MTQPAELYDYICECNDINCWLKIKLPLADIPRGSGKSGDMVIIVDGCKRGPESGDALVETRDGYKVYKSQ
jgi:hypothetical protein